MKSKYNFKLVSLSLMLFLAFNTGCYYDQVYVAPVIPDLPDVPVSFATEIQPIFTAKCIGCHSSGSPAAGLDLTDGNAYASINVPKYISLGTPAESLIYTKPDPAGAHFAKYSTTEAAIVLKWIEEGAQDN
jgi:hypothetical protein